MAGKLPAAFLLTVLHAAGASGPPTWQLQPGVDGLLMEDGRYRSIFLPQVWEKLGSAQEFLEHLLSKAGLPGDYWSGTIRFSRFHITLFSEE